MSKQLEVKDKTESAKLADNGSWSILHDSHTDWAMLLGAIFVIIKGSDSWSLRKKMMHA